MRVVTGIVLLICLQTTAVADWKNWWKTPEQQALELYESGETESLIQKAPTKQWQGIGQFESGDFEAASQTFSEHGQSLLEQGVLDEVNRALYNGALSDIMSGQYQKAIEGLDALLQSSPDYDDAQHNRDIAQQLLELEQQQENSEQNNEGESGEQNNSDSEQSESSNNGDKSDESSNQEQQDSQNSDSSNEASEDESDASPSDAEQQQQDAQDASEALQAEADRQAEEQEEEPGERELTQAIEDDQPLSESEQATEQLLRRIPDDPRGLLRRKLEQSHLSEYPEVRDAIQPW